MDYGKKNKLLNVVLGFILKEDNSILLVKRKKPVNGRIWVFPGGIIEPNENRINALEREIYEEANIITRIIRKLGQRVYSNKKFYYYQGIYIYGNPKPDKKEIIEAEFFSSKLVKEKLDKRKVFAPLLRKINSLEIRNT